MFFANHSKLLEKAQKGKYAVPHFNFYNLETLQSFIEAAEKTKSPLILGISESSIKYAGLQNITLLAKTAAHFSKVPISLHLDHGRDLNLIKKCIKIGFSSVMYDGSHLPFKKNIQNTKRLVQLSQKHKVHLEAELGQLKGIEDNISSKISFYTNPEQAKEFVKETKCDSLAISIGTSHGVYKFKGTPKLDFNILKEVKSLVKIPLVLHGASSIPQDLINKANKYGAKIKKAKGVPDLQLKKAIRLGICKVNTDSDFRLAFVVGTRKSLLEKELTNPREFLSEAKKEMTNYAIKRIKVLGSQNKA